MANDPTRLFQMIARTPGIRMVQLADQLDIEIDQVVELLAPHLTAGVIVSKRVPGANGIPSDTFNFSESFKQSDFGAQIIVACRNGAPVAGDDSKPSSPTNSAPAPVPAAEITPKAIPVFAPGATNVEKAEAFIGMHGTVTAAELHKVLCLKPTDNPSSFLKSGIASGRLVKDGKYWTLGKPVQKAIKIGPKTPPPKEAVREIEKALGETAAAVTGIGAVEQKNVLASAPALLPPVEIVTFLAASEFSVTDVPASPPAQAPVIAPRTGFRFGCWSDDTLAIERDGVTVAEFTFDQAQGLRKLLNALMP